MYDEANSDFFSFTDHLLCLFYYFFASKNDDPAFILPCSIYVCFLLKRVMANVFNSLSSYLRSKHFYEREVTEKAIFVKLKKKQTLTPNIFLNFKG